MLMVGSYALRQHYTDCRASHLDVDIIAHPVEVNRVRNFTTVDQIIRDDDKYFIHRDHNDMIWEYEIAGPGHVFHHLMEPGKHFASPEFLFWLKWSHRFKGGKHFWKTRGDIEFLRSKVKLTGVPEWFHRREKESYVKTPSLKQSKQDFFTDSVRYIYDHDWLHTVFAMDDRPAYLEYIRDGAEVDCDPYKFNNTTEWVRRCGVMEEAMVLAFERSLAFRNEWTDAQEYATFKYALMKVCTTITGGWFRDYAWENCGKILRDYPVGYIRNKFKEEKDNAIYHNDGVNRHLIGSVSDS